MVAAYFPNMDYILDSYPLLHIIVNGIPLIISIALIFYLTKKGQMRTVYGILVGLVTGYALSVLGFLALLLAWFFDPHPWLH